MIIICGIKTAFTVKYRRNLPNIIGNFVNDKDKVYLSVLDLKRMKLAL